MKILGIDPGLSAMGYGIIEKENQSISLIISDTIRSSSKTPFPERLSQLYLGITQVIEEFQPDVLVMEKPIYCQNMKTALVLGQAGGMAILACAIFNLKFYEFTSLEVKKSISGSGKANKEQVQKMVKVLLNLKECNMNDHQSDALACAICLCYE